MIRLRVFALGVCIVLGACSSRSGHKAAPDQDASLGGSGGAGIGGSVGSTCTTAEAAGSGAAAPSCATPDPMPSSCDGLTDVCGDKAENCCTSCVVAGGEFKRSDRLEAPATVRNFRLDKFEITVGRFRKFVEYFSQYPSWKPTAGSGRQFANCPGGWDQDWQLPKDFAEWDMPDGGLRCQDTYATWTSQVGDNETRPINCITWYEAYAFCIWDGGFLPTEAEWNYAAAGGSEQRPFPWGGEPPTLDRASYYVDETQQCMGDGQPKCALTDLIFVGTKSNGDGKWGQSDLAGNVFEWTLDSYVEPYSSSACDNCAYVTRGQEDRVMRGGSFSASGSDLATAKRDHHEPLANPYDNVGARCARPL